MSRSRRIAKDFLFLALCCVPVWFSLGDHAIHGDSEARYGVIARGMAEGDAPWLVPHYFDRPHLTKPPGNYWLLAGSIRLLGDGEWALRLPAAISGTLTLALCLFVGRRLYGPHAATTATALLAVTPLFVAVARLGITDSPLSLCIALTIIAGLLAEISNKLLIRILLWISLSAGLFIKGPVALLGIGALLIWMVIRRLRAEPGLPPAPLRLGWSWGLPLACLPLGLWLTYIAVRQPDALAIWNYEIVDRATGAGDHPAPWWYFGPVFLFGLLPSTVLLCPPSPLFRPLAALFCQLKTYVIGHQHFPFDATSWQTNEQCSVSNLMNSDHLGATQISTITPWVVMIAITLTVFTLITGKLTSYLMPICLPTAMVAAVIAERRGTLDANRVWKPGIILCVGGGLLLAAEVAEHFWFHPTARDLVQIVQTQTGLSEPRILTVGFGEPALAYYSRRPTTWVDPRLTRELWESLPRAEVVVLADPEAWQGFAESPTWDPADRYERLDWHFPLPHRDGVGDAYRILPRHHRPAGALTGAADELLQR